jgi:hypothetical protein
MQKPSRYIGKASAINHTERYAKSDAENSMSLSNSGIAVNVCMNKKLPAFW